MGRMKFYFAPLEGVTGYTLRNVHHACYPGIDWYFTPFISPNQNTAICPKEERDVALRNNVDIPLIPQILTNRPDLFLWTARELKARYGYNEVNLNLGCPSKTVVSKGKGSGLLLDTDVLDWFFEEIFTTVEGASAQFEPGEKWHPYPRISVKTRLGMNDVAEFPEILQVYNDYPLSEVIIHARVQKEFYKGKPHLGAFVDAMRECKHSLCYNGDICSLEDYIQIKELFPTLDKVMIGRGLMANPELVEELQAYEDCIAAGRAWTGYQPSIERLRDFHNRLLEGYLIQMNGDYNNVLFKMKELWEFMGRRFKQQDRLVRKIVKATRLSEYEELVGKFFERVEMK